MKKLISCAMLALVFILPGCDKDESYDSGPQVEPERLNDKVDVVEQAGGRIPTPQQMGHTNDKGEKPLDLGPIKRFLGLDKEKCGCESRSSEPAPAK